MLTPHMRVEGVARRTRIGTGRILRYEEEGLVAPSERDHRGVALWTEADIIRLERIHSIVTTTTLSLAEIASVLAAEAGAREAPAALDAIVDPARRREHVARTLADLEHARVAVSERRRSLDQLDEALAELEHAVRELPANRPRT
jgi:DNA-binding transcriptional MerR regulator